MKPETRRLIARELLILGAIIVGAFCAHLLLLQLGLYGLYNSPLALWFSPKGIVLTAYFFRWVVWAYRVSRESSDLKPLADRCLRATGVAMIGTGLTIAFVELIRKQHPQIVTIVFGVIIAAPGCWLLSVGNRGQQKQESLSTAESTKQSQPAS